MRVDKVIVRAALSTLAAIIALIAFMILALSLVYPATLMKMTYDLGMENLCIANAKEAYKRSGEVYYIAFATEVAIGEDDYAKIEGCGQAFIADDEFEQYCTERNEALAGDGVNGAYEQYVYGQVCVAKYRLGRKDTVEKAFALVGEESFPENNAVVAVLLTALMEKDDSTVEAVRVKMNEMQGSVATEDKAYFDEVLRLAQNG